MSRTVEEFIRAGWEPWSYEIKKPDNLTEMINGWAKTDFAVDQRNGEGWHITHLPTGWRLTVGKTFTWCAVFVDLLVERSPGVNWSLNDAVALQGDRLTEIAATLYNELEAARQAGLL